MFHESDEPILANRIEEAPYVGVDDEIHLVHVYPGGQSIQRVVRSASGSKPVGEPEEVLLVDGVEDHDERCR